MCLRSLMPRYRRRRRLPTTQLVRPVQHADSLVNTIGPASSPTVHVVLDTEVGARTTTGGAQTIQVGQGTNQEVNVGSVVKYMNLFIQVGPKPEQGTANDQIGWLEWAFVCVKETETTVPITNLGTSTLGTVCTNMFRNECILTGNIPIGANQANSSAIKIKVPSSKQRIHIGDQWRLICYFRDVNATSTTTNTQRLMTSCMFKSYN